MIPFTGNRSYTSHFTSVAPTLKMGFPLIASLPIVGFATVVADVHTETRTVTLGCWLLSWHQCVGAQPGLVTQPSCAGLQGAPCLLLHLGAHSVWGCAGGWDPSRGSCSLPEPGSRGSAPAAAHWESTHSQEGAAKAGHGAGAAGQAVLVLSSACSEPTSFLVFTDVKKIALGWFEDRQEECDFKVNIPLRFLLPNVFPGLPEATMML